MKSFKELKETFYDKKPQPVEYRKVQLRRLQQMVHENTLELHEALYKDLHKSPHDAATCETNLVVEEISHVLDNLDAWVQTEKRPTPLLLLPGSSEIQSDPLGVVFISGPWNYPICLTLLPLIGAIAAGNCIMVKLPSTCHVPNVAASLMKLLNKYMDSETLRVFGGGYDEFQAMLKLQYDMFFYTGGSAGGKLVAQAAASHFAKCVLELGGKSPTIIAPSANVEVAAKRVVWGAFLNAGQTCIRPDHVFVHESVADEFLRQVKKAIHEFYGDSKPQLQSNVSLGRIVNDSMHQRLVKMLEADKQYIIAGGETDRGDKFVSPTLLDFGSDIGAFYKSHSMQEEIFGPILPLVRYRDLNKIVDMTTRNKPKALTYYVFAEDKLTKDYVRKNAYSGNMMVNDCMINFSSYDVPFGGIGASGAGRYRGKYSFEAFSHQKSVVKRSCMLDVSARYPPITVADTKLVTLVTKNIPNSWFRSAKCVLCAILAYILLRGRGRPFVISFLHTFLSALQ